jgi:hypothetical protein
MTYACQWNEDGRPVTTHHDTEDQAFAAAVAAARTTTHVVVFELDDPTQADPAATPEETR